MTAPNAKVLSIKDLTIDAASPMGRLPIVTRLSLDLAEGEVLGIVGESGSGKSVTMLAVMRLLATPQLGVSSGEIWLGGRDLLAIEPDQMERIRGKDLAMIFQEPMTSLNPVLTIGRQIGETIAVHNRGLSRGEIRRRGAALLERVGVPGPERRMRQYPHEFSGGMRQRVMIAIAIANDPKVLIADEPTTALDVTIQAQVMEVLAQARAEQGAAMILVTHDLGLVAETADRVAVMYGGRIVETGPVDDIFARPCHPYTVGLMRSLPRLDAPPGDLYAIPGQPPAAHARACGCVFNPRCEMRARRSLCVDTEPALRPMFPRHLSACHFAEETRGWAETIGFEIGAQAS